VSALLGCHRKATVAGEAVDPRCLDRAHGRLADAFAGADASGTCAATGNVAVVTTVVDAFVDAIAGALPGDARCAAATLRAARQATATAFGGYASLARRTDYGRLVAGRARVGATLESALRRAPCTTPPDPAPLAASALALAGNAADTLLCGDGIRELAEACDGTDDAACPGRCQASCRCPLDAPFACLAGTGPLVTLSGTRSTPYTNDSLAPDTRIDARTATFLASPTDLYPLNLGGAAPVCVAGGQVRGQYDRSATWSSMHDQNNAGVRFENDRVTVDGVRVDDVTDGIRPVGGSFTIRQAWLSYVRDDCVENDHLQGGLVEDALFDGCYVAVSERPSPEILAGGANGRRDLLTIRDSLIHLQPMPGPEGGSASELGNGQFFKWHDLATALALHDNVFMAEQVGQNGAGTMAIPESLVSCANNVMVWLGPGAYPAPLPACFTVTKSRSVWDAAVAAWKQRHPQLAP